MPDYVEIRKYSGMSTFLSKEDRPIEVLQEARNLRFNHTLGRLVKRGGYTNKLTTGLTSLKNMIEFKNKNSEQILAIMDGNTLERSVYSGGSYGAIGSITNDERTAGSTIDGDNFHPIIVNKELRSGAGISASTELPIWYGYIAETNRFNDSETITAGRYLDEQYYSNALDTLFSNTGTYPGTGIFEAVPHLSRATTDSLGLTQAHYALYAAPVFDGYQTGFPKFIYSSRIGSTSGGTEGTMEIYMHVADVADAVKVKRITHVDLFIAVSDADIREEDTAVPAYFLERISLNNDTKYFYETAGTADNATAKITITNFADWLTFDALGLFFYNITDDSYHRITAETVNGADMEFTVTPAPTTTGAVRVQFLSRWYSTNVSGTDYYLIRTFYDNYFKKLGSEMYAYLNLPTGDTGLSDFRYLYSANNGVYSLYGGFPNDKNFSYFSVAGSPDIVPAQNIFRHKADVRGIAAIGKDFLVFTDIGIERITILDNAATDQNDEYLDAVLVDHKAIAKISDNEIAFMSYKGAYIISDRRVIFVGKHLNEWFIGSSAKLSQTQKEACVAHFNDENNEVWFSFPTYTTSPYTAGVTMVFDIEAYRGEDLSAWWFVQSDIALLAFTTNSEQKMLAGAATKIVDMDAYGTDESVSTGHKLKLLKGAIPNRLVRWGWLHQDSSTDDTVSVNLYFDGSASAVSLTLNTDYRGLIAYLKKTLEVEITTAASTNTVEHLGTVLEFQPKRVA